MISRFVSILFCAILLLTGATYSNQTLTTITQKEEIMSIQNILLTPQEVTVHVNGKSLSITQEQYVEYISLFQSILNNSHDMPAFGVSLDQETKKAMQSGTWLQLVYPTTQEVNGLPFDILLIELHPNDSGFNIIRGNNSIYDGRCFYIDLVDTTLASLYEWANNLF